LTGCVIRPAIETGIAGTLFGPFFAVLLLGQLGRMAGDILSSFIWQVTILRTAPWKWNAHEWRDLLGRVAFCWVATIPKATLQASLPSKLAKTYRAGKYTAAAAFVGPAAAIAILYMATLGSLLTFSAGSFLATYFQNQEVKAVKETEPEAEELCTKSSPQGSIPGSERVGPVVNLLTGVDASKDEFVAGREVTINITHQSPSSYLTGTAYADILPTPQKNLAPLLTTESTVTPEKVKR